VLKKLYNQFFVDTNEAKFIKWYKATKAKKVNSHQGEILVDALHYHPYIFQTAMFSDFFNREEGLVTKAIVPYGDSLFSKIKSTLFGFTSLGKIYKSFSSTGYLKYYSVFNSIKLKGRSSEIFKQLISKQDLIELRFENIPVGDLIYDSYLRNFQAATVDLEDIRLKRLIHIALVTFYSSKNYINSHNVKIVLLSHSVYIQYGIIARIAVFKGIDTFVVNKWGSHTLLKLTKDHYLQTTEHNKYPNIFKSLTNKEECLSKAKNKLEERFLGVIDSGTSYMINSAYSQINDGNEPIFIQNNKNKVLIMLHCFFDSPHIYNGMIFNDFYEWITYTLLNVDYEKNDIYLKPHPNGLPANDKIIDQLKLKYSKANFIDKNISNLQILNENIDCIVTVYGTVAHEFAYHNIPVITAGDNPHSAYSFCNQAKNKENYLHLINNVESLQKGICKEEIEEFFYMHYLHLGCGRIEGKNDLVGCARPTAKRGQCNSSILNEFIFDHQGGVFYDFDSNVKTAMSQFR
jgi:hypothetical protein